MKKIVMKVAVLGLSALPLLALAQTANTTYIKDLISKAQELIALLIPLLFAAAILGFLYGVGLYLFSGGDEGKKEQALGIIKWGIIFLVVMFGVYGLINIVGSVLGINPGSGNNNIPTLPTVPRAQ